MATTVPNGEPSTVAEALENLRWKQAMQDEYTALMKMGHGILFRNQEVATSLDVNGFTKSREELMGQWIGIKQD
jgi:hypothetical protein